MNQQTHTLEVWGSLACFTQPALKVERFSYPCPTPSAARGILEAVYCKPKEFIWQVRRIEIFNLPRYIALRRNEVKQKINVNAVLSWMHGAEPEPIWADGDSSVYSVDTRGRTQRQTMALQDVRYRITAEIRPWPEFRHQQKALDEQFIRRARKGQCFHQPYFGCREFVAYFELVDSASEAQVNRSQLATYTADLGYMLYDVFDLSRPGTAESKPAVSVFPAKVVNGVLDVPEYSSNLVRKVL
jgi:CRISPR-associated protein Cas5d